MSEVGAKDVVEAVVVVIADADAVGPASGVEAGLFGDVGEGAVAIVFVEAVGCFGRIAFKASAGEQEDIHPAVVVVVDEGAAATVGFQDVFVGPFATIDGRRVKTGSGRYVVKWALKGRPEGAWRAIGLAACPPMPWAKCATGGEGKGRTEGSAHEVAARNGHGRRVPWRSFFIVVNEPIMAHTKY